MIEAILLGKGVLPLPAIFSFGVVMVAIILHLKLSMIFGLIDAYL